MPRPLVIAAGAVALTAIAGITMMTDAVASSPLLARGRVEQPKFTVLQTYDTFEVRRYEKTLVAEVEVEGAGRDASSAGFRVLADFIFGNNAGSTSVSMTSPVDRQAASSEKIAMTSPVDRRGVDDRWVVTFTMPSKYTIETLPKPNDPRVKIREVPAKTFAVFAFSGSPSERKVQERMEQAKATVDAAGLERSAEEPHYARYDPPWTPSFLRHNEILIEINVADEATTAQASGA